MTTHPPPDLGANYAVRKELGRGGMGTVYLVHNAMLDRLEVVKVLNPGLVDKPGVADRFLQEIQAAARLNHPNVVTAFSVLRPAGGLALAMMYVEGTDLHELVRRSGPLTLLRACNYTAQAARGLEHAREQGLTHRDIKPSNLMATKVMNKTVVKVLDFGLAKLKTGPGGSNLTHTGQMMGTPAFVAPEQAKDAARADTRADVYSLGCTLYFLLTGRPPFVGTVMNVLAGHALTAPQPLPELRPDVPPALWDVVAKMLAKDPADRYQTPGQVEKALLPFVRPAPTAARLPATPQDASVFDYPAAEPIIVRPPDPPRRAWSWAVPVVVLILTGLVGGVLFGRKAPAKPVATMPDPPAVPKPADEPLPVVPPPVVAETKPPPVPLTQFTTRNGTWRVQDDVLEQSALARFAFLSFGDAGWTDYDFTAALMRTGGNDGVSLLFREGAEEVTPAYLFNLGVFVNKTATIEYNAMHLQRWEHLTQTPTGLRTGVWYDARVEVRGDQLRAYLDDKLLLSCRDGRLATGRVGVRTCGSSARFRNLRVTAPDGTVLWDGLPAVPAD